MNASDKLVIARDCVYVYAYNVSATNAYEEIIKSHPTMVTAQCQLQINVESTRV